MDTRTTTIVDTTAVAARDERGCVLSAAISSVLAEGRYQGWQPMGRPFAAQHLSTPTQGAFSR